MNNLVLESRSRKIRMNEKRVSKKNNGRLKAKILNLAISKVYGGIVND